MSTIPAINDTALANDDVMQRKAGEWVNRTMAQIKTDLVLVKADVGLGNVENTALSTWAGSTNITTLGTILTGSIPAANVTGLPAGANPSGTIGLAAVNGSATTFIRSDGAPALSQSIAPTWTGVHTFTNATPINVSSAEPRALFTATGGGTDGKLYDIDVTPTLIALRTRTDADGAGINIFAATRTAASTAITNVSIGNATNNPSYSFLGTGTVSSGGGGSFQGQVAVGRINVTSSTIPANGIFLPGTNRLGFTSNTTLRGEFDANGNFLLKQAMADQSYSLQVPTTGFSITIADNISSLLLNPAGTLATGTVTLPATPINGQIIRIASSQIITTLTISPNSGQTMANAFVTTLGAGSGKGFIYNLSGTTWFTLY